MSAEEGLYAALSGATAVTAIVSNRIFSNVRDQDSDIPAVVITRTGTQPFVSLHSGEVFAEQASLEVHCFEHSREQAEALAGAVQAAAVAGGFLFQDKDGQYDAEADLFFSSLVFTHNWSA